MAWVSPLLIDDILPFIYVCPYDNENWQELKHFHYYDVFFHDNTEGSGVFQYIENVQFLRAAEYKDYDGICLVFQGKTADDIWRFALGEFTLLMRPF